MNNFPIKDKTGKEWWISRSVVCSGYVFAKNKNGQWTVLAAKRGSGSTNPHKWNIPGGFLDFNETLSECCAREVHEETGVNLSPLDYRLFKIHDIPSDKSMQHINCSFYSIITDRYCEDIKLSNALNEHEETESIRWIPVDELVSSNKDGYRNPSNWLRNHCMRILWVYTHFVNPSIRLKLYHKISQIFTKENIY